VRRSKPFEERFWSMVRKTDGCWLWTGYIGKRRYGAIWDGERYERSNRASWRIHFGPIPKGLCVCHTCDVPSCVRPDHLFLGTKSENMRDMVAKGRHAYQRGRVNNMAKLTPEMVLAIRNEDPLPSHLLSEKYGVSSSTIRRVRSGGSWRNLNAQTTLSSKR
jgi:hypothetical protein